MRHAFEPEQSVNLIPGLGPIHLPSNHHCRHCGQHHTAPVHLTVEEQLAERIRRHEADARDLEQLRIMVRDESQRAHEAEGEVDRLLAGTAGLQQQRDALADALLLVWRQMKTKLNPTVGGGVHDAVEAALKLAGRL